MQIKVGDRVIYSSPDSRKIRGTVLEIDSGISSWGAAEKAHVLFDDLGLMPSKMWIYTTLLEKVKSGAYKNPSMDNCICGLKFIKDGGDRHSTWCSMYRKPEKG